MQPLHVVLDTNVIVAALRSQLGASYKLLMHLENGAFETHVSVPLVLEYEYALKAQSPVTADEADDVIDYICSVSHLHKIYFLWRPVLGDPGDDMILELAVAAECKIIVTHNKSDFKEAEQFGIRALTPREFLQEIGELS